MADLRATDEDEENKSTRQRQHPPVRDEMRDHTQQEMHDQKGVTEEMHDQEHQETHRSGALVKRWLRGRRLRFRRMWKKADCSCAFRSLVTVSHELTHTHTHTNQWMLQALRPGQEARTIHTERTDTEEEKREANLISMESFFLTKKR